MQHAPLNYTQDSLVCHIYLTDSCMKTKIPKSHHKYIFSMAKENEASCCKPHILMVPCPAQGHIIPMFKLAKLLHHQGFYITFLNTDFNHQRLLRSHGVSSLEGLIPNFEFASIPDGLPVSDENATQDPVAIMHAIRTTLLDPFRDFLSSNLSKRNGSGTTPVTWIITDAFNSFAIEVAQQFSIPTIQFVIHGASPFLSFASFKDLIDNELIPLKDEECHTNGYLETIVDCVRGLEGIQMKYLSRWILTTDMNHPAVEMMTRLCETSINASSSAILINTFEDLEFSAINQLSTLYLAKFLPIGPIHLLENQLVLDDGFNSFEANLWKEDSSCIEWLDSKPSGSVLFVSFGSMARLTAQEMIELAWGLANTKHYFMWVIRPDLVKGEDGRSTIFPQEFDVEIKGRGFLPSWCPQEKVLGHPAIGGFLTQCGWNSLLESMCCGVPVLCWPNWAEQVTNGWCCCNKWKMGMELDTTNIGRDEIERVVKEIMNGNKGQEIKKNAMVWKKKAEDACTSGSSRASFGELVKLLRSS